MRLARVCGLILQSIGCTFALACDVQRYCSCSCRLWRYISVMLSPLPFTFIMYVFLHFIFLSYCLFLAIVLCRWLCSVSWMLFCSVLSARSVSEVEPKVGDRFLGFVTSVCGVVNASVADRNSDKRAKCTSISSLKQRHITLVQRHKPHTAAAVALFMSDSRRTVYRP